MSNQLVITSGAKVRNLSGVLTGTSGVVSSVPYGGANGVATLDGSGKVPLSQLPASVITYLGTWNASTNTPTLTNGVGDTGDLYICNVAGTVNFGAGPITFAVGDWVIYSGTTWEKSGGASGTVTSVAMTVPTGLSVTGSPITTSGTLAVSLASGYTIPTTSFLSGLVPYTSATGNVNLGEYGLSGGYLGLDTTPTGTPTTLGTLSWDDTYLTPKVITGTGVTTLQIGQEEVVLVHNNTGSTLTDGQVVYINGSTGNLPTVALADASSETTSAATLGVVTESIANGSNGFITISGNVNGLNTLGYTAGDILWLSETAGQFTNVKPISPAHLVLIGYVVKVSGGNGSILVKIQNTQELEECSDVLFTSLANNDILAYESSTDLWKNKTIANVLGYTPANDSLVVHLAGTETITGLKTFSNQTIFSSSVYINSDLILKAAGTSSVTYLQNISSAYISTSGLNALGFNSDNDFYMASNGRGTAVFTFNNAGSGRTYTLPNTSGTVALTSDIPSLTNYVTLTGAQTITGIKTFTNEQLFGNGMTLTGGYITYTSGSFNLTLNTNLLTANRNIYLPDASGTVALTSSLGSYVPYSGATGTVDLGANNLYAQHITLNGVPASTVGGSLLLKHGTNYASSPDYTTLTANAGGLSIISATASTGSNYYQAKFDLTSLTANTTRTYTLPNTSGTIVLGTGTTNYLPKFTGTSAIGNSAFYEASGNLLIGSTTAGWAGTTGIELNGNETVLAFRKSGSNAGYVYHNGTNLYISNELTGASAGSVIFNNNAGTRMVITSTGNVGIGISPYNNSITKSLDMVNGAGMFGYGDSNYVTGNLYYDGAWKVKNAGSGSQITIGDVITFNTTTTGAAGASVTNTERMRIAANGAISFSNQPANAWAYTFNGNTTTSQSLGVYIKAGTNSSDNPLYVTTADGSRTIFNTWGDGSCFIQGAYDFTTGSGANVFVGSNGKLYRSASSLKYKKDVKDYDKGLAEVLAMRPVYYKSNQEDDKQNQYAGLIAEEIHNLGLTEFVQYAEDGTPDALAYQNMVALLTKAIQELSAKVTALENKS